MFGGGGGSGGGNYDYTNEELVAGTPEERNWKGIGIALLTILSMCATIILAVVLLTPGLGGATLKGDPISLVDIISGNFSARSSGAVWVDDDLLMVRMNGSLMSIDVSEDKPSTSVIVDSDPFEQFAPVSEWQPSSSLQYIAFAHHPVKMFKHSYQAFYNIRNVAKPMYYPVKPSVFRNDRIQLFKWNPKKNAIDFVFVFENNLYYQSGPDSEEGPVQLTFTSNPYDYNGIPDWLYEEEIFSSNSALWWSPDGDYIAYAHFNDTGVPLIEFPIYRQDQLYPDIKKIPYPKVGEPIPRVQLNVWKRNTEPKTTVLFELPAVITEQDEFYLLAVTWLKHKLPGENGPALLATWSNRAQNIVYFTICSYESGKCVLNVEQKYEKGNYKMWADPIDLVSHYSTPTSYFMLLPEQKRQNVYTHVANISIPDNIEGGTVVFLESGEYDITSIAGYDSQKDLIYFIAAAPLPRHRNLYRVGARGSGEPECLTCWMNVSHDCTYFEADFSPNGDHFVLKCKGPGRPREFLMRVDNTTLLTLENNTALAEQLEKVRMPKIMYKRVELREGFHAEVKLLLPPTFSEAHLEEAHPVVLRVYAGPGTQEVAETWRVNFDTYLASQRSYVVAYIDGRGSGYRGWAYKSQVYRNLGTKEIEDQLAALRSVINTSMFIDPQRVAVWGWSYGGFAATLMAENDRSNTLDCAAAVAPVTHFTYYDATYTERFMGLQEDNLLGYDKTNIMKNVSRLQRRGGVGVDYLLIHGTGDDNVHFQNTAVMIKQLTSANIQFQLMIYTNEQHSISGDRSHLNHLLDKFFQECFEQNA